MKFKSNGRLIVVGAALLVAPLRASMDGLPGASTNPYMDRHVRPHTVDRSALREQVDETQALFDSLARESRRLDKSQLVPLFKSLKDEYHLDDYVGKARKSLEQAEAVLAVQDAIKSQQARVKDPALDPKAAQVEDTRLLSLQNELVEAVDKLRTTLGTIHENANEDVTRDLHNWIMISEGLLRQRREDAEAKRVSGTASAGSPTAQAPLSAANVQPQPQAVTRSSQLTPQATEQTGSSYP